MIIASIREVGECLVYLTSWPLCRPRGPLTLRRSGTERRRLISAESTDLHTSCGNKPDVCSSSGVKHEAGSGKCPTNSSVTDIK